MILLIFEQTNTCEVNEKTGENGEGMWQKMKTAKLIIFFIHLFFELPKSLSI